MAEITRHLWIYWLSGLSKLVLMIRKIGWLCHYKDSLRSALLFFLGHSSPDLLTISRVSRRAYRRQQIQRKNFRTVRTTFESVPRAVLTRPQRSKKSGDELQIGPSPNRFSCPC